jgi:hypothetical protein
MLRQTGINIQYGIDNALIERVAPRRRPTRESSKLRRWYAPR